MPQTSHSDMADAVRIFLQTGIAPLPFPFSVYKDELFDGMNRLIREPPEYRRSWMFYVNYLPGDHEDTVDPDDGLVDRLGGKNTTGEENDSKFFLHFRPNFMPSLLDRRGVDYGRYISWLKTLLQAWKVCHVACLEFAEELDRQLPGYNFRDEVERGRDLTVLRLLWYRSPVFAIGDKPLLAARHTDRDFITLHVAENYPGLLGGEHNEPVTVEENIARVFAGKKAQIMTGGQMFGEGRDAIMRHGVIKALPHAVHDVPGRDSERMAWVMFCHTLTKILKVAGSAQKQKTKQPRRRKAAAAGPTKNRQKTARAKRHART